MVVCLFAFMNRTDYILRRFLLVVPTFIGITLLCFAVIQFVPGGPVEQAIMRMRGIGAGGESSASTGPQGTVSDEQRAALRAHYGFDKPFLLLEMAVEGQNRYADGVLQLSEQDGMAAYKREIPCVIDFWAYWFSVDLSCMHTLGDAEGPAQWKLF